MNKTDFPPKTHPNTLKKGSVSCQAPSNIALVKYWGKYGEQLPQNTSVSFTLSKCRTETTLYYKKHPNGKAPAGAGQGGFNFETYLDGKRETAFDAKINKFFQRIYGHAPFIKDYTFTIETKNTFPHSSGIASSASGMGALALCISQMGFSLGNATTTAQQNEQIFKKASFLARLGSGSASRSIQGPLVVWGEHPKIAGSSNHFGIKYPHPVHSSFSNYRDTILLVDKGKKQVSSTLGHELMHGHPYAATRFKEANKNVAKLIPVLKNGDIPAFIEIVESEALQLHAMMMASKPYFILMKPNTLKIINLIWEYRKTTGSNLCFTLDAGANVHVLYPGGETAAVSKFIAGQLAQYCKNGGYINDRCGLG
ncbi:MAG: diphosphomevalonate/mevalonate 3,5-bisphosphate decarboxylase family protein, partial [Marinirhabdus sp.]